MAGTEEMGVMEELEATMEAMEVRASYTLLVSLRDSGCSLAVAWPVGSRRFAARGRAWWRLVSVVVSGPSRSMDAVLQPSQGGSGGGAVGARIEGLSGSCTHNVACMGIEPKRRSASFRFFVKQSACYSFLRAAVGKEVVSDSVAQERDDPLHGLVVLRCRRCGRS